MCLAAYVKRLEETQNALIFKSKCHNKAVCSRWWQLETERGAGIPLKVDSLVWLPASWLHFIHGYNIATSFVPWLDRDD